jgi:adenylate kinase
MAENATYIVLMGMQGAGKGTQASVLSEKLGIPHVTTGGMFRAMKTLDTPLAHEIQALMAEGKLISDEITIQVVRDRLTKGDAINGVILDGFPRTRPQAEALDALLKELDNKVSVVPFFKLDKAVAVDRIASRWQCSRDDSHVYNLKTNPPQVAGRCDIDDAPLIQRPDDTPEAAEKRISLYLEQTTPLLDYYRDRGLLCEIDASQPISKVTDDLLKCVG